ncbi:MAG: hypothetical protein ABXS92_07470 [Sulfurimonas sp.]
MIKKMIFKKRITRLKVLGTDDSSLVDTYGRSVVLTGFKERAEARRDKMSLKKVGLHSEEHHSFHLDSDGDTLSRLVFDMSHPGYGENGGSDTMGVDKRQVRMIKLKDK